MKKKDKDTKPKIENAKDEEETEIQPDGPKENPPEQVLSNRAAPIKQEKLQEELGNITPEIDTH